MGRLYRRGAVLLLHRRSPDAGLTRSAALQLLRRLEGHSGYVTALTVSPDGRFVYSGGFDGTVKRWDT
jgi:WD40 repeat protein